MNTEYGGSVGYSTRISDPAFAKYLKIPIAGLGCFQVSLRLRQSSDFTYGETSSENEQSTGALYWAWNWWDVCFDCTSSDGWQKDEQDLGWNCR